MNVEMNIKQRFSPETMSLIDAAINNGEMFALKSRSAFAVFDVNNMVYFHYSATFGKKDITKVTMEGMRNVLTLCSLGYKEFISSNKLIEVIPAKLLQYETV